MDWIKAIYGALGAKHPTASLVIVIVLGAALSGVFWKFAGYMYERDHATASGTKAKPGGAVASGDCSAAVDGTGNTTKVSCDQAKPEPKKP